MIVTMKSDKFSIDFDFPASFVNSALLTFMQCQMKPTNELDRLTLQAVMNQECADDARQPATEVVSKADSTEQRKVSANDKRPEEAALVVDEAPAKEAPAKEETMEDYGFTKSVRAARNSSVARMFGERHNAPVPATPADTFNRDGYRGFLIIKCRSCGNVHAFCPKQPVKSYNCPQCNSTTELVGMRPAFIHCECGGDFKYRTNIQDKQFTYTCFKCGSPVEMELNGKGNAFVTIKGE